jgi:hypothetical protein
MSKAVVDAVRINRRQFLEGLAAVGATIALPIGIAEATPAQVDEAWASLAEDPWYFEVGEWGNAIVDPDVPEPMVRSDVFGVVDRHPRTLDHLISQVENIQPLQNEFQQRAFDVAEELWKQLDALRDESGAIDSGSRERQIGDLNDAVNGWEAYLRIGGDERLDEHWEFLDEWMQGVLRGDELDYAGYDWHGQGRAFKFFAGMDRGIRDELGVVVVEGDHPGSDYLAAELRGDIGRSNLTAERLGLPFRFRRVTS